MTTSYFRVFPPFVRQKHKTLATFPELWLHKPVFPVYFPWTFLSVFVLFPPFWLFPRVFLYHHQQTTGFRLPQHTANFQTFYIGDIWTADVSESHFWSNMWTCEHLLGKKHRVQTGFFFFFKWTFSSFLRHRSLFTMRPTCVSYVVIPTMQNAIPAYSYLFICSPWNCFAAFVACSIKVCCFVLGTKRCVNVGSLHMLRHKVASSVFSFPSLLLLSPQKGGWWAACMSPRNGLRRRLLIGGPA